MNRASIRFLVTFFVLVLGSSFLVRLSWIDQHAILPYTRWIVRISSDLLNFLGTTVGSRDTYLVDPGGFTVNVRRGCDGVVAGLILVSAVLAYPARWKSRLTGILAGFSLIFVLNLVRILALFWIGLHGSPRSFNFVHTYVSQFVIIGLAMVFWLFWVQRQKPLDS